MPFRILMPLIALMGQSRRNNEPTSGLERAALCICLKRLTAQTCRLTMNQFKKCARYSQKEKCEVDFMSRSPLNHCIAGVDCTRRATNATLRISELQFEALNQRGRLPSARGYR